MSTPWSIDPLLVWGLFSRGIGLVLLISFTSLSLQVVAGVGSQSILPVAMRLAKLRQDFPTWRRYLYFPTLLWVCSKDWFLQALPIAGMLAAASIIYGGPHIVWALLVCYLCYLSLDLAMSLVLPWDTLLFETMVVSLLLPATRSLPSLLAVSAPAPAVTWAFRLLFFRVMFGFGKQKFMGSRKEDLNYLSGFLLNQPLLSPGGWYAQKLPAGLLKLLVVYMFLVEVPIPFFAFVPGPLSAIAAVCTIMLMAGIQATGNFGYFSILTMVASIPLLDQDTPRTLHLLSMFDAGEPVWRNAFVVVHTCAALITFPFNSWLAQGWHLWAFWYQLPRVVQGPLNLIRWLHPLRWVHPYGVFPPNTTPAVKITLLVEVTWDKQHWHELKFAFAPSNEKSAPRFVAPHHPRGEQAIIYDTFGMNYTSLLSTIIPAWDPSGFGMRSPSVMFAQSIVRTAPQKLIDASELGGRSEPFLAVRITTVMLEPVSLKQHRETGDWWKRTYIGPHVPPEEHDPHFHDDVLGEPELWSFDSIFWRRRSRLAPLMKRAMAQSVDALELARFDSAIAAEDVVRFWTELVPLLGDPARASFDTLPETVRAIEQRFDRGQRRTQYRLLGRFALILICRLEPLYLHRGLSPLIPVPTYFHLWMLVHHVIGCGKDAYLAAVADPPSVKDYAPALTPESGLYGLSAFRLHEMTFDAQKLRLLDTYFYPHDPAEKKKASDQIKNEDASELPPLQQRIVRLARRIFGLYGLMPHLREGFRGPSFDHGYPELYPTFKELPSGEVVVDQYAELPQGTPLDADIKSLRR